MTTPDPSRYLAAADDMLRGRGDLGAAALADGWWPKACACLIRLALEATISAYWHQVSPPVAQYGNGRMKLLLLRRRLPDELVRYAAYTWAALSRATHHHCYESSVSAVELRHLHAAATSIAAEIARLSSGTGRRASASPRWQAASVQPQQQGRRG
ncbi:hypothetical protein GCM10023322_75490 [Rugosimonospora acidiphila]|uniref:SAV-6107-like HEPN domain-containing protein n=1 Tax=Rugosimonospora acidiphila TaxID=556531 RepID=A0ABP9SRV2_9ACTN